MGWRAAVLAWIALGASAEGLAQSSRVVWDKLRQRMVDDEIVGAGITDKRVIAAMRSTPRHEFVPLGDRRLAYFDMALPIGSQQTISPPYVVAFMTQALEPKGTDRVLEIGTGSGYQAAVLAPLVRDVYTIEIVPDLGRKAEKTLRRLKYGNVHTRVGDGFAGWPEAAPFDKIIVTCSPESPPKPLVEQLAEGGRMVIPVGERHQQNLCLMRKVDGELERESLTATLFVPMTGQAEERRQKLPDASNPRVNNGGFEEEGPKERDQRRPAGWHYVRQANLVDDSDAPQGTRFLRFENSDPGRGSQALQGFAIDGRKVSRLKVSFRARGEGLRSGLTPADTPRVLVTFYDDRRGAIADEPIGPLRGWFPWTPFERTVAIPLKAREGIVRIGLLGGVGRLDLDAVSVAVEP
ncbi:MAG: protein-L-isoaspartate(D-aspartate) O-methyltransferase [Lacipirellulaceae bacterium]